jgi:chromosome partitioning protein
MIVAICSTKGGVGKTSVTTNLAVAAGKQAVLVDLDRNQAAAIWWDSRKANTPRFVRMTMEDLDKAKADKNIYFVDTPPQDQDLIRRLAKVANLVIIPTLIGAADLRATSETAQAIKDTGGRFLVVLNRVKPRSKIAAEVQPVLASLGAVSPVRIGDRTAVDLASFGGAGVIDLDPKGASAEEFRALWAHIYKIIHA